MVVDKSLHILFNPPYGERLPIDVDVFYSRIGDTLKQSYSGSQAWLITANMEALKFVGLRPSRRIKVFNGKLESKLVKYALYSGTKKIHKIKPSKSIKAPPKTLARQACTRYFQRVSEKTHP